MTILWCGGEDVDFPNGTFPTTQTSGPRFDSSYTRCALSSSGYACSNVFAKQTDLWLSFRLFSYGDSWVYDAVNIGIISDGQTNTGFWIRKVSGQIVLAKNVNGTLTNLSTETGASGNGALSKIDVHVVWGESGTIDIYFEGNSVISYSGDTRISGSEGYDRVGILGYDLYQQVSEVFVADEDTRLMRLKTLAPSAAGDTSANWTGAYTDIDETTLSDSDKIYSATDNADFQCNLTGMPSGTWSVKAVKIAARCVDGSASTGIQLGVKSGGTVDSGDTQTASGYWQTKERLMQVNPVTGVAFTPAEIEALQINLRAKAL